MWILYKYILGQNDGCERVTRWSEKQYLPAERWQFVWFSLKSSGDKHSSIDSVRHHIQKKVLRMFLIYLNTFWTELLMILVSCQIHLEKNP